MKTGTLYVVATPIGNLGDWSHRGEEILRNCDFIACEDTRVTGKLLHAYSIPSPKKISYREENEEACTTELVGLLREGHTIGLVCDAGTPAISDPGFRIVRACRRESIPVEVSPGANAAVAALSASGLPSNRFYYIGFLPPKTAARRRFLQEHKDFPSTLICYESVHRIGKFLQEILSELGPSRTIGVARELTKKFETFTVGPAAEVQQKVETASKKGEFVVLIAPEGYSL